VIDVDAVRGLMREQCRYEEFMAAISRPPRTNFLCAACHPKMSMVCMDACFKLWRYARDFKSEEAFVTGRPGAEGSMYAETATVEALCKAFKEARGDIPDSTSQTCGTSDIADLRHKAPAGRHLMDVTASYFATCPHSIFLKAFDFHGGELHDFSVAMYVLLGDATADVICGDTMCQVNKRFKLMQELHDSGKLELPDGTDGPFWKSIKECVFAVNAMHIRGVCARETCNACPARAPGAFTLRVCTAAVLRARARNCKPLCAPTLTTTPPALAPCFMPLPTRVYAHCSPDLCSALLSVPPPAQLQTQAGCRMSRRRGVRASTFAVPTSLHAVLLRARVGSIRV
jgi:hypothetical protein